jgi:hypothetical protein
MRKASHLKMVESSGDELSSHNSVSYSSADEEESASRLGESSVIMDSYTKIWESIPEKGGNSINARVSRSPDLLHS